MTMARHSFSCGEKRGGGGGQWRGKGWGGNCFGRSVSAGMSSSLTAIVKGWRLQGGLNPLGGASATMATSSAMLARLHAANLPHDELLRVCATHCETFAPLRHAVDALLSHHHPVPQWAVTAVLLSPDLIPDLFASLE